jgi:hypothetical protein
MTITARADTNNMANQVPAIQARSSRSVSVSSFSSRSESWMPILLFSRRLVTTRDAKEPVRLLRSVATGPAQSPVARAASAESRRQSTAHGRLRLLDPQVAQQPVERLRVGVVVLPAGEVAGYASQGSSVLLRQAIGEEAIEAEGIGVEGLAHVADAVGAQDVERKGA